MTKTADIAASMAAAPPSVAAAGAWIAVLSLLALIIRSVGPWRKQTQDAETKLRDDLIMRVTKLEQTLEKKDAIHSAERALDRHRLNNVTQCLDALLLMLKRAPEKVSEIVADIEEMRARQIKAEATEKATLQAALVEQAGDGVRVEDL